MSDIEQAEELARIEAEAASRFQGYQLPKIQLDSTGPTYYLVSPHPYFYNQPRFWQQAVFSGHPNGTLGPQAPILEPSLQTTAISMDRMYPFLPWGSGEPFSENENL